MSISWLPGYVWSKYFPISLCTVVRNYIFESMKQKKKSRGCCYGYVGHVGHMLISEILKNWPQEGLSA